MSTTETVSRLSRQELTRLACDALAAAGKKPSIGLVREWTMRVRKTVGLRRKRDQGLIRRRSV